MRNAPKILLKDAIAEAGSVSQLATRIGYTRARVYQWLQEKREHLPELAAWRLLSKRD